MKKIIVKTYGERETIWVSQAYLIEKTGIKEVYLRARCRPRYSASLPESMRVMDVAPASGKAWRWSKMDGGYYYDHQYIPNNAPAQYQSKLGTEQELLALRWRPYDSDRWTDILRDKIEGLLEHRYGMDMRAAAVHHMTAEKKLEGNEAKQYAESWAWARLILDVSESRHYIQLGLPTAKAWYSAVGTILAQKKLRGMKVSSEVSIRNKLKTFPAGAEMKTQWEWFLHTNIGNQHRVGLTVNQREILIYLRGKGMNWSDRHIARKLHYYNTVKGLKPVAERTITEFLSLKSVRTITEQARFGRLGKYRTITQGRLPIAVSLFAGDCWQVDATRANIISHQGEDGKHRYWMICVVRDVHSGLCLGWSYGYQESHAMYHQAIMMAVENAGYLPYELVRDKFPGHNTEQWKRVEKLMVDYGVNITETTEATGKAPLERFFGTLQSVFMSETPWYYGEGVASKRRYTHVSEEFLAIAKKSAKQIGWDGDKSRDVMDGIMERYNTTLIASYSTKPIDATPLQLHEESDKPHVIRLLAWQYAWIFQLCKTIQLGGAGLIRTEIAKCEHTYRLDDYVQVKQHDKVQMVYDVRDLSSVRVFSLAGKYLGEAVEIEPVQIYGPKGNRGRLSSERAKNRHFAERAEMEMAEIDERVEQRLGDELSMLCIRTPKLVANRAEDQYLLDMEQRASGKAEEEVAELTEEQMEKQFRRNVFGH